MPPIDDRPLDAVAPPPAAERGPSDLGFDHAAAKVRQFPTTPGVYLMKDAQGRVIYIGKASNLRSRASSYFHKAAAGEHRTADLVKEIADIDFLAAESEVDALLMEARLIKDIQPKFNRDLKDDKSFPYLQITQHEDYPRVEFTREPRSQGVKLYGPFGNAGDLRAAIQVLQRIFKFRTCSLDIDPGDERWRWFRPCLLASIRQCTAPCNLRISPEDYRRDIARLRMFLDGKKESLLAEMRETMQAAAKELKFEQAARLRDEIQMLESLDERGKLDTHVQPEVFYIDPKKGLAGLKKILKLDKQPRTIEGVDIAHLGGGETVASLVQFIDGLPFKPGYRRYRIRGLGVGGWGLEPRGEGLGARGESEVRGGRRSSDEPLREGRINDDFASIHEVVLRRFQRVADEEFVRPDVLLIDGGKGQLNAGLAAFRSLGIEPPIVLSLAKREEEVFAMGIDEPLRLSRRSFALRLLQYVRDEAHRFAQHYHHILRKRATLREER